ncbi:MAG: hypothetical protein Q7J72_02280 [Candidatus Omnitrophota bacterium]|nr:hypothetical protein [Candidatus Omnitrophota bacterium]
MEKRIIIIAGEPSGDLQASLLIAKIKEIEPQTQILAVGGDFLRRAGARVFQDIQGLSVLGFFDALKKIGEFKQLMRTVLAKIEEVKPDAVILVDFSGFNLRLAKKINPVRGRTPEASDGCLRQPASNGVNKRFKTIYYISPQVWASREGRIKTIKKYIDKMIVIFEFEKEFYAQSGIEAEFVGHPLLDIVKPSISKEEARREFGLKEESPIFALLPGSRATEVKKILPIMLKSAKLIQEKIPSAQFIISKPSSLDNAIYERILKPVIPAKASGLAHGFAVRRAARQAGIQTLEVKLIESRQYDCLNVADFVLVCSGTATLETAIMQKPNVIIYKMGLLNYLLYRPLVRIPFIGMENIVAGKLVAPEFIQFKAKPKAIAAKVVEIFQDNKQYELTRNELAGIKEKLGEPQGPLRAAKSILALINSANNG